ncbi:MAG: MBOAT family protein, partial [Prevotella sp.]|nr:MBOAT family protein [Prevotella sp.]
MLAPFLNHFMIVDKLSSWHLLLPIGLSFYLFMSMSYVIDSYRRTIATTPSFLNYVVYMSFFPHLVAGPIDRARLFIPQLEDEKYFKQDLFISGLRQMLYGFFKKLVIADNLALIVSQVWNTYPQQNTFVILLGTMAYSVQIYADFSGYSDIAIGIG